MRRIIGLSFSFVLSCVLLFGAFKSFAQLSLTGAGKTTVSGGGCSPGTNATNYLARTSGYNATHTDAFCNFINGLDTDSLFAKMAGIWVFGTSTAGNAVLNLISTSFTATANGSPAFTADKGYTGADGSTTVYVDLGINVSTAGTVFTQNSAHASACSLTNLTSGAGGGVVIGMGETASTSKVTAIFPKFADGNMYAGINTTTAADMSAAAATSSGFYVVNRSGATASQLYKAGSSVATSTTASNGLPNINSIALALNDLTGGITFGSANQIALVSLGGSLNSTDVTNFKNRISTLSSALGWGAC